MAECRVRKRIAIPQVAHDLAAPIVEHAVRKNRRGSTHDTAVHESAIVIKRGLLDDARIRGLGEGG